MRFLLDHDVPDRIGDVLRAAGHEVSLLREVLPTETSDRSILTHASAQRMILITCNRDDFLQLTARRPHSGLIVLIRRRTRIAECAALLPLLNRAGERGLMGNVNFA